jgi:acetyltransferase
MLMRVSRCRENAYAGEVVPAPAEQPAQMDGEPFIRAARAADASGIQDFVRRLTPETRRKRFFGPIIELSPGQLQRLTSRASADDLNLLVLDRGGDIVAMAQCVATGPAEAEFALVVADNWQRRGIGMLLCCLLLQHARKRRLASLGGFVLSENRAMLGLASKLGFSVARDNTDASLMRAVMALADPRPPAPERARVQERDHAGLAV